MIWIVIAILVLAALVVGFYPLLQRMQAGKRSGAHPESRGTPEAQNFGEGFQGADHDHKEPSLIATLPPQDLAESDVEEDAHEHKHEQEREHQLAGLIREQALKAAKDAARAPLEMPRVDEDQHWKALVQESYQKRTQPPVISVPLKEPESVGTLMPAQEPPVAKEPVIKEPVSELASVPLMALEPLEISTQMPVQEERAALSKHVRIPESSMTWSKVNSQDEDRSILSLYVMAARSKTYSGDILAGLLKQVGLQLNSQNIFEYREDALESSPLFYAASAMKPGVFDLKRLEEMKTQGVALFMDCSKLTAPKKAFLKMLEIAHVMAGQLKADILDGRRERLTESGIAEYLATLKAIEVSRHYE